MGKVRLLGGKPLMVGGKVALSDACCCGTGACPPAPEQRIVTTIRIIIDGMVTGFESDCGSGCIPTAVSLDTLDTGIITLDYASWFDFGEDVPFCQQQLPFTTANVNYTCPSACCGGSDCDPSTTFYSISPNFGIRAGGAWRLEFNGLESGIIGCGSSGVTIGLGIIILDIPAASIVGTNTFSLGPVTVPNGSCSAVNVSYSGSIICT